MSHYGQIGGECHECGKEYKPDPNKMPKEKDIVFGFPKHGDKNPKLICIECFGKKKERFKKEIQFKVR